MEFDQLAFCIFAHHVDAARDAGCDDQATAMSVGEPCDCRDHLSRKCIAGKEWGGWRRVSKEEKGEAGGVGKWKEVNGK